MPTRGYLTTLRQDAAGLKAGCADKDVWKLSISRARQMSMAEDLKLLHTYHSPTLTPADIESQFRAMRDAAGRRATRR